MPNVELFHTANHRLGEAIIWHEAHRCLYWIDLWDPALHKHDPATGETTVRPLPVPAPIGAIAATGRPAPVQSAIEGTPHPLPPSCRRVLSGPEAGISLRRKVGRSVEGAPLRVGGACPGHDSRGSRRSTGNSIPVFPYCRAASGSCTRM